MRDVRGLVPHAGAMCLLDRVLEHSAEHVRCSARSHREPDNPLLADEGLPAHAGIEYAAQATAVHAALMQGGAPVAGMLAGVRRARFLVRRLNEVEGTLIVSAQLFARDAAALIYTFDIASEGAMLLEGKLTIALLR